MSASEYDRVADEDMDSLHDNLEILCEDYMTGAEVEYSVSSPEISVQCNIARDYGELRRLILVRRHDPHHPPWNVCHQQATSQPTNMDIIPAFRTRSIRLQPRRDVGAS